MADKENKGNKMVQQYTEMLEQGIRDVFENGKFDEYLQTMSRFHGYSARNITLIHQQLPGATHVAGFNKWRDEFDRHVVKGQSAIKIWAPTPYKVKEEQVKTDPNTGRPIIGADGKAITEEVETTRPSFKLVNVFDVSQTDGKPLPQLSENIDGDVQYYDLFRQALEQSADRTITYEAMRDGLDGFVKMSDGSIHIATGMSQAQTVAALLHEMTHATLGHDQEPEEPETDKQKEARRNREEIEAESVAYVVAQHFGIDTGANSFGYVASWSKDKELDELKASLDTIKKTASQMITAIDEKFTALKKEHGIEQITIEAEAVRVIPSHESAMAFATDYHAYMQAHNEAAGLPRFGMDEPHLVIAQITQDIIDGSGIEDIRDTIQLRLDNGVEAATAEKLLRRLRGFEKVEYIMPEPEQGSRISTASIDPEVPDEPDTSQKNPDTPEQFANDYVSLVRDLNQNGTPYPDLGSGAEAFAVSQLQHGVTDYIHRDLQAVAQSPEFAEQAKALMDRLAVLPVSILQAADLPAPQTVPDFVRDFTYIADSFRVDYPTNTPVRIQADLEQQMNRGNYSVISDMIQAMAAQPSYRNVANTLEKRLAMVQAIQQIPEQMLSEQTADLPDTAERLAYDLNEFAQSYDPYEYGDQVEDKEELIQQSITVISSGGTDFEDIKVFLRDITADENTSDDVAEAKNLLDRLTAYGEQHHTASETQQPKEALPLKLTKQVADLSVTPEQRDSIADDYLIPLNKERALELFSQNQSIYRMDHIGNALMVLDENEIMQHDGLFAIDTEEWQELFGTMEQTAELESEPSPDILLPGEGNRYAIYQIENTRDVDYAFRELPNMESLQYEHYKQVYTAPLEPGVSLDDLWNRHNADDRPAGQTMRSMSMSDVVVMVQGGGEQAFYVDHGFTKVPQFLEQARAAETSRQTKQSQPTMPEPPESYRYYSTQRPVDIGTYPTGAGTLLVNFENYDTRQWVENDTIQAWGYLEYRQPLTEQQISDYELKPAPDQENHIRTAEMSTEDNYNMIDGIPNNTSPEPETENNPESPEPGEELEFMVNEMEQAEFGMSKADYIRSNFGEDELEVKEPPTLDELEADAASGKQVSLLALANAMKADKNPKHGKVRGEKPSVLGQLKGYKEKADETPKKQPERDHKNDEREV